MRELLIESTASATETVGCVGDGIEGGDWLLWRKWWLRIVKWVVFRSQVVMCEFQLNCRGFQGF